MGAEVRNTEYERQAEHQGRVLRGGNREGLQCELELQQIPGYNDLSPEGRDRWKGYISMSLGKPKNEVKPADWEKVDNWKIPSLVKTSIDTGFRPIEVERSKMSWLDLDGWNIVIRPSLRDSST
jgi:hypothetical protein